MEVRALLEVTAYSLATRYIGIREYAGPKHHPLIQWWFTLCNLDGDTPDEVPWCSAFVQGPTWELRLPRSKIAAARSWLAVGYPISLDDAEAEFDVVVLKRGLGKQPGPEVTSGAAGHVGFFAAREGSDVLILGGNQNNQVCIARYPVRDVLGVRRLVG